eukprot:2244868-Rhodomonas_salina.2
MSGTDVPYAMSGTDEPYAAIGRYAMPGTEIPEAPLSAYAVLGAERAYGATTRRYGGRRGRGVTWSCTLSQHVGHGRVTSSTGLDCPCSRVLRAVRWWFETAQAEPDRDPPRPGLREVRYRASIPTECLVLTAATALQMSGTDVSVASYGVVLREAMALQIRFSLHGSTRESEEEGEEGKEGEEGEEGEWVLLGTHVYRLEVGGIQERATESLVLTSAYGGASRTGIWTSIRRWSVANAYAPTHLAVPFAIAIPHIAYQAAPYAGSVPCAYAIRVGDTYALMRACPVRLGVPTQEVRRVRRLPAPVVLRTRYEIPVLIICPGTVLLCIPIGLCPRATPCLLAYALPTKCPVNRIFAGILLFCYVLAGTVPPSPTHTHDVFTGTVLLSPTHTHDVFTGTVLLSPTHTRTVSVSCYTRTYARARTHTLTHSRTHLPYSNAHTNANANKHKQTRRCPLSPRKLTAPAKNNAFLLQTVLKRRVLAFGCGAHRRIPTREIRKLDLRGRLFLLGDPPLLRRRLCPLPIHIGGAPVYLGETPVTLAALPFTLANPPVVYAMLPFVFMLLAFMAARLQQWRAAMCC